MNMSEKKKWYKLDNAAIIIPPSTHGSSTRVFRIVCQMKDEIDPTVLQQALDETCEEFPHFNVILRSGLFWYYLDETKKRPVVHIDNKPACGPIYMHGKKELLYEVSYFHNRINLEMFHVLSDGTGAFVFFKQMIIRYIELRYACLIEHESDRSSMQEKTTDAFRKFYQKETSLKQLKKTSTLKAYQLKGTIDENMNNHLLELTLSSSQFAKIAKQHNTTVSVLAVSLYLQAIAQEMSIHDHNLPIVISVPVNLRTYFPSETTRNFYGTINVTYHVPETPQSLDEIMLNVQQQFKQLLKPEEIRQNMNSYSALEHNLAIKMVPLFLKDIAVAHFGERSARGVTGTISNLGRIQMPPQAIPYIDFFSAFMAKQNMQITVASFEDVMTFGICTNLQQHSVIHRFVRSLKELGLEITLATNDMDQEEA